MKKVLVITYYWPPAGGSGVQRWLKFIKYFRDFGVEPIVYTVKNPKYPIVDDSLENDIPKGVKVLKQPIFEPNSILNLLGQKKTESAGFLNPNPTFFGKIMQYIRANYFIPDSRKFWVKPSVRYLKNFLSSEKIETVITTGPPHSVHLIGLNLKQQLNCNWIADFRDPWTEIDYFHQLPLTKRAKQKHFNLEELVVKTADKVLVVGNTLKNNYSKISNKVITVTNGFDNKIQEQKMDLDSGFTLTHVGLMNADRNPEMLWEVISELVSENSDFALDFKLKLIGKVDTSIKNKISEFRLQNFILFIDYVSHNKVIDYQKKSQVLLLVVNNVPSAKGIITGKIFEYLMAKRPILAIAPKNGDLASILTITNAGEVVDFGEKELLKQKILDLYNQYKKGKLEVASKNIEQYHRKELTKKVSEIIYDLSK